MSKVVLGFSGGVDSAVCAHLLRKAGHEVAGLYLDNADETARSAAVSGADYAGIPLEIIDVHAELENTVCKAFARSYISGETPNPCIICNPGLKFRHLLSYADRIGAEFISTGHYARASEGSLYKGHRDNDQSYMLCRLTKEQASRLILPLGEFPKTATREIAKELDLPAAGKPDSMEICFIPDKDYIGWLASRTELPGEGPVLLHGNTIGTHPGIYRYTVGQRYPGLIDDRKVYVCGIDPKANAITLAFWDELFKNVVFAHDFSFLESVPDVFDASVRVRHTKWEEPACRVHLGEKVTINCAEPVRAPANGQSAVLYDGDKLLGGGFICGSTNT